MKTIHRDIVSAVIFSEDGKLLMGMKDVSSGGVYADCWHIPGGGIDEDESHIEALNREMVEEVGIDISGASTKLIDDQGTGESIKTLIDTGEVVLCKMKFNVYSVIIGANSTSIETKLSDDLVKTEWIDLKDLTNYKLTPPSVVLFKRLGYLPK